MGTVPGGREVNQNDVAAFPLCWPEGWPRTKKRKNSQFKVNSVYDAVNNLRGELSRMGVQTFIVSTSIPLRRDGLPLSKPPVDGDPGAAIYFTRKGKPMCLACDQYTYVEDNIHAIAKTLEAIRGIERWGSTDLVERAFLGFAALPSANSKEWWDVLGVSRDASLEEISRARNTLAMANHPDRGGDTAVMAEINAAWESAKTEKEANK
jgi:DnaJ domain